MYVPTKMAPDISQTVANQQAVRIERTPEPTLVPNEFATSFAPMPNAKMNAITKPKIIIHKTFGEYASNILEFFSVCFFFLLYNLDFFFFNVIDKSKCFT